MHDLYHVPDITWAQYLWFSSSTNLKNNFKKDYSQSRDKGQRVYISQNCSIYLFNGSLKCKY